MYRPKISNPKRNLTVTRNPDKCLYNMDDGLKRVWVGVNLDVW